MKLYLKTQENCALASSPRLLKMILVPDTYESSGQQLGETRQAMTKTLMKDLEKCIDQHKDKSDPYYVLVHAKPWPQNPNIIKIKLIPTNLKPPMMLSCMLFRVDNRSGKLELCWSLPGSWPVYTVEGTVEPIPETIASINELGVTYNLDSVLAY